MYSIHYLLLFLSSGRTSLSNFPCVKEFVPLPNGGEQTYLIVQLPTYLYRFFNSDDDDDDDDGANDDDDNDDNDDNDGGDDDDDDLLGHCPMDQIPETVNQELLRFLSDIL